MDHKSGAATYQAAPLCKTRVDIAAQSIYAQSIAVQSIAAQSIVTQRMPQTARLP